MEVGRRAPERKQNFTGGGGRVEKGVSIREQGEVKRTKGDIVIKVKQGGVGGGAKRNKGTRIKAKARGKTKTEEEGG